MGDHAATMTSAIHIGSLREKTQMTTQNADASVTTTIRDKERFKRLGEK
jgi:hypothetical protein